MRFGGYFMNFSMACTTNLSIDIGKDTNWNNQHLEWPINNWFCTNGKLYIKAALLK